MKDRTVKISGTIIIDNHYLAFDSDGSVSHTPGLSHDAVETLLFQISELHKTAIIVSKFSGLDVDGKD